MAADVVTQALGDSGTLLVGANLERGFEDGDILRHGINHDAFHGQNLLAGRVQGGGVVLMVMHNRHDIGASLVDFGVQAGLVGLFVETLDKVALDVHHDDVVGRGVHQITAHQTGTLDEHEVGTRNSGADVAQIVGQAQLADNAATLGNDNLELIDYFAVKILVFNHRVSFLAELTCLHPPRTSRKRTARADALPVGMWLRAP